MQEVGTPRVAARSSRTVRSRVDQCAWTPILVISVAAALMTPAAQAQPSAAAQETQVQSKGIEVRKQAESARRPARAASPPPVAEAALEPQKPAWPVNNPPSPASVVLDSRGLRVDAMNSSLLQILKQVCAKTGAKIEGLNADQRVFGVYGPGQPRDVIAQLLEGTGYNLVMVGSHGEGATLQIVLSKRPKGGAEPNAPVRPSDIVAPPSRPPVPVIHPRPQQPKQPPRTPQQILQEMRQRQQQLRQEQMRLQQMRQRNNQQQ